MTTPRNDIVRLRLTTLEKQDWATAAGGSRKLSEWIRSVCNAAAQRAEEDVVPNAKPVMVKDAIEREMSALKPPVVPPPLPLPPKGTQCDRWMHHRKGVYCGSCKRVTT